MNLHLGAVVSPTAEQGFRWLERGALLVDGEGSIAAVGDAEPLIQAYPTANVIDHGSGLLLPGFVDAHVHFPQYLMAGSHGESLLTWLERYTFPAEIECADQAYAEALAGQFLDELARQGTTAAFIFGVSYQGAMEALVSELNRRQLAAVTGNVWMDRNGPAELLKTPADSAAISHHLIGLMGPDLRLGLLPRFVPSCSEEAMARCAEILAQHPEALLQSHLAETLAEQTWVAELHPEAADYTAVYESFGMLGSRSSFAHGVHLGDREWSALAASRSSLVHCPTANLFLGSGLFDLRRAREAGVSVGLGTDVGAGTSLCMLESLKACYQVQRLQGASISVEDLLSLATLGSAGVLGMADRIGSLEPGKRADFILLQPPEGSWLAQRWSRCDRLEEQVFAAIILGSAQDIAGTWIRGRRVSP